MADLSITVANCKIVAGASSINPVQASNPPTAGTTITAGMVVYLSAAGTWLAALSAGTALQSGVGTTWGVALHAALTGQPLAVLVGGQITIGATVAVGTQYFVSETAGMICPAADLTTGDLVSLLGFAISTTVLDCSNKAATGIAHA